MTTLDSRRSLSFATAPAPVPTAERVELLDVVRGVALFGIVSANMIGYSLYLYLPDGAKRAIATHASDRVLDFLELFLIEGKFYTIFSIQGEFTRPHGDSREFLEKYRCTSSRNGSVPRSSRPRHWYQRP
jgi:hypothetical protein